MCKDTKRVVPKKVAFHFFSCQCIEISKWKIAVLIVILLSRITVTAGTRGTYSIKCLLFSTAPAAMCFPYSLPLHGAGESASAQTVLLQGWMNGKLPLTCKMKCSVLLIKIWIRSQILSQRGIWVFLDMGLSTEMKPPWNRGSSAGKGFTPF